MEGSRLVNIILLYRSIYVTEHTHYDGHGVINATPKHTMNAHAGNTDLGESDIIMYVGTIITGVLWSAGGLRALASDKPHRELALCISILHLYSSCKNNII